MAPSPSPSPSSSFCSSSCTFTFPHSSGHPTTRRSRSKQYIATGAQNTESPVHKTPFEGSTEDLSSHHFYVIFFPCFSFSIRQVFFSSIPQVHFTELSHFFFLSLFSLSSSSSSREVITGPSRFSLGCWGVRASGGFREALVGVGDLAGGREGGRERAVNVRAYERASGRAGGRRFACRWWGSGNDSSD